MATNLIALIVLMAWIPLREMPGLGTIMSSQVERIKPGEHDQAST
ncbi:hypothetical protein [Dermatophilus congolensis]|uniref:Uncharacterized protein n=1 Tax=Dermatophilus congolensis TaxID=1863 RepID=A0A239V5X4_9MICO|nr:hypothetical protein [Dermatophilus congolensis]SNV17118.1 Uncharacterised protein [Dermatophilus congolensis]